MNRVSIKVKTVIYQRSNITLLFIIVAALMISMELIPQWVQSIPDMEPTEASTRLGQSLFTPLFSSTAFLIGFLLSRAYGYYQHTKEIVSIEAGQINNLDRLLLRYAESDALEIRHLLKGYIESIVHDEWPVLIKGNGSEKTHMIWRSISQKIFKLEPSTKKQEILFGKILEKSEETAESRERRIDYAGDSFPAMYWVVISLCMLALICLTALYQPEARAMLGFVIVPIALGGLITLLVITDQPFCGQTSVKPEALNKVLESLKTRKF